MANFREFLKKNTIFNKHPVHTVCTLVKSTCYNRYYNHIKEVRMGVLLILRFTKRGRVLSLRSKVFIKKGQAKAAVVYVRKQRAAPFVFFMC